MPTDHHRIKGLKIYHLERKMCKKNQIEGGQIESTNVGLLNVSSDSFGESLNAELVVELVGLFVLLLMLLRWLKKCLVKRKMKQRQALSALIQGAPPAPQAQPPPIQPQPVAAAAPGPQIVFPMRGAMPMPALEYKCADQPRGEIWTQA